MAKVPAGASIVVAPSVWLMAIRGAVSETVRPDATVMPTRPFGVPTESGTCVTSVKSPVVPVVMKAG